MPFDYRKPGVYVEESLLVNSADNASATSIALFVGTAGTGPTDQPVRCDTWSEYVLNFGNFDEILNPETDTKSVTTYLPYAVYSYFQNGGRPCYVQRAIGVSAGSTASFTVTDGEVAPDTAFEVEARSVGSAGNAIGFTVTTIDSVNDVFTLTVYTCTLDSLGAVLTATEIERFQYLTMTGDVSGTRRADSAINDPYAGSSFIRLVSFDPTVVPADITEVTLLETGTDPDLPDTTDYPDAAVDAVSKIEGPIIINLVGYTPDRNDNDAYVAPSTVSSTTFPERGDLFIINDNVPPRTYGQTATQYKSQVNSVLSQNPGDSYVASFTPWIIIPNPKQAGSTITIPPGGAVAGVISRIDSTIGVFRAPAGLVAAISNAVGVDTKYTDGELGDLNSANINVIRPVAGAGIAIMGARTRKIYGADRYISARRTLIYIKESMRRSTQFALFENNDQRLWTQLRMTAERLLRPLWEAGGLRGNNAAEAYYIKCDSTLNTPSVIASGEVRMEIGVALEYPAEFIVIRVTQFESGGFTAQVQPKG
jgi:hypothetical protein